MYTPAASRHFVPYTDPQSGVVSYILQTELAPLQQNIYYVNSGMSEDGRYLWFRCANPPRSGHHIALLDFETDEITEFPETHGHFAWYVDPVSGDLWWSSAEGIMTRAPRAGSEIRMVAPMPEEARAKGAKHIGTHLTFTPDRREIIADIQLPGHDGTSGGSIIGSFSVADGSFTEWYRTGLYIPYNHAQCSPISGDLCLCAHEGSKDPKTMKQCAPALTPEGIYPRLQLISRDGTRRMLTPHGNYATHECWAADGKSLYYCARTDENDSPIRGQHVVARDRMDGSEAEVICCLPIEGGTGAWHAHAAADEKYFVIDGSMNTFGIGWWRGVRSCVRFYNTETKKWVYIISENPVVNGYTPENPCPYHIDPHPRFVCGDTMIAHTTTVRGRVDAALTPVEQLKRMTG